MEVSPRALSAWQAMEVVRSRGQRFTLTECSPVRNFAMPVNWLDSVPTFDVMRILPLTHIVYSALDSVSAGSLPSGASHSSELPLLFDLADGPIDIATAKKIPLSDEAEGSRKSNDRLLDAICAHRQSELLRRVGMAGLRGSRPSRCRSTCAGNFHAHAQRYWRLNTNVDFGSRLLTEDLVAESSDQFECPGNPVLEK